MLTKTIMNHHFTSVRMAITIKTKDIKELVRACRKGNPDTLLVGCKLVQLLWKTVLRFLKNMENRAGDLAQ